MPTYEYRCTLCGHDFERFQKITVKTKPRCPECGGRTERIISGGTGLLFKGSGFYITDYKRAGEPKAGEETGAKADKSDKAGAADKADKTDKADRGKASSPTKSPKSSKSSGAES